MAGDSEKPSRSRDQSLVSYSNKRTRRDIPSSSSTSEPSNFSLNDLQVLLIEVLQRLPTTKSAFLCKCICKNWYSLISSPYFIRRFITHHLNHQYKQNPSALVISCWCEPRRHTLFTCSDEPMFKFCRFELNHLPKKRRSVDILAIFNDLMLCSADRCSYGQFQCYVCNPFTKQQVALPLLDHETYTPYIGLGFVCEPYYSEDSQGGCSINSKYRFRVVHIAKSMTQFILWTFCSETQKWYRSVLEGSEYQLLSDVVAYNGKLLWYNGISIFAYDPFYPELSTFIDCSYIHSTRWSYPNTFCIGVCQGFLCFVQLVGLFMNRSLTIWKLKDYNTGEWSLKGKVYLNALVLESTLAQEIGNGINLNIMPLGLHPSDGDIVYLNFKALIISCNMRTKELKMAGKIPGISEFYSRGSLFRIELPLWPTPIAKPIEILPRY